MDCGKTVYFITGATGFIGGLMMRELIASEDYREQRIRIIAAVRDREKFRAAFHGEDCSGVEEVRADLRGEAELLSLPERIDYIIHCAAETASGYMLSNPVETADGIVLGTRRVLEIARVSGIRSMVFLSSMEVYGRVDDTGRPRGEEELGDIPLDSPRSCYPLGKRMAEHYCHLYRREYGVPVKIARLAQVFGRGVRGDDGRVYMQFARAADEGKDIVLHTPGMSMGNYCDSGEAVEAIFLLLREGRDGEAYNVVNEANTMSIRDMAELVANQVAGGRIQVRVELKDRADIGYAPDTALRLSGEKLRKLGWKPRKGLAQMYEDVLRELRGRKTNVPICRTIACCETEPPSL